MTAKIIPINKIDKDDEPTEYFHYCPYAVEINGDYEEKCNCFVNDQKSCAEDI